MPEKDPNNYTVFIEWMRQAMPYLTTIVLSMWGGLVNHIQTLKSGKRKFRIGPLIYDLITSTFAGMLTFYLCRSANVDETISAVLIAISGHMGTRAITGFEALHKRVFGITDKGGEQ